MDWLRENLSGTGWIILRTAVLLFGLFLIALFVRSVVFRILLRLTRRTQTSLDDRLILALRSPVLYSLILAGIAWIVSEFHPPASAAFVVLGIVKTLAVLIWGGAALRIGAIFLEAMSRNTEKLAWIQPRTVPILRIAWQVLVIGGLCYFLLISWRINPTSWLASAGVLGLAIGFAAKDTLANLFAGIFILADAPYRIGDFVILQNGQRGVITDIGMRSSRMLTRDDVQITVPNAIIANGDIVNETSGRFQKMRVRVKVGVAYGSDIDQVRATLLSCVEGVEHICNDPEPRVRFREFGESGLRFELLAWITEPVYRGRVLDQLHTNVYQALRKAGIEIPYPKQDVFIKQMPS